MFGGGNGASVMAIPNAAIPSNTANARQQNAMFGLSGGSGGAFAFVAIIILYVVWALVQQHQKLRDQIKPSNLALNFHNRFAVALQVVVALGLVKLVLALANKYQLPGAKPVADAVEFSA